MLRGCVEFLHGTSVWFIDESLPLISFFSFILIFNITEISHTSASAFLERTAQLFQVTNTNKSTKIGSRGQEKYLLKAHLYTCHLLIYLHFSWWIQNHALEHSYHFSSFFFISSKLQLICTISLCNILIELKCKFLSFFFSIKSHHSSR